MLVAVGGTEVLVGTGVLVAVGGTEVLVGTKVLVGVGGIGVLVGVLVAVGGTEVLVGSGVFVAVGGIGVLVAVAGIPTVQTSKLQPFRLPPSRLALSSTRSVQVPALFCPSKADSELLGW